MNTETWGITAAFALYLAGMVAIGVLYWRKTTTVSQFILGNRELGGFVAALSAEASDMSGWLLIGLPGLAYASGMQAGWVALGLIAGTYLNWKYIAPRLRVYSFLAGNALTLPEFFRNRFADRSHIMGLVCAGCILFFFIIYTSAQFVAGATLFTTVFGIDYTTALFIGTLIIVVYTFTGGFRAVCITDTLQGILMFFALLIVPVTAFFTLGGPAAVSAGATLASPHLFDPFTDPEGCEISLIAIVSLTAWGLGYFGQPHILVRFMAIEKPEMIKDARRIAMTWVILSLAAAIAVGIIGRAYLSQPLENTAAETIFMVMTMDLFTAFLAGLILCGILAAIMSTASSILLVTASALSQDVYFAFLRPGAQECELLWVSRLSVLLIALFALVLGMDPGNRVFSIVAYAWAGFGAAFGPALIACLFWRRTTREGVLAGIMAGGLTVILWKWAGIPGIYEIIPGFFIGLCAIGVVSRLTPEPGPEVVAGFDAARNDTKTIGT